MSFGALSRKRMGEQNERDQMQDKPRRMTRFPTRAPGIPIRREDPCMRSVEESCVCWSNSPKKDDRKSQYKADGRTKCKSQSHQTITREDGQQKDRKNRRRFDESRDARW